jgi:hypothetical protein
MSDEGESSKAKRWRERAEQCRSAAEGIKDEASRRQMLSVAESYDRMAMLAEQREKTEKSRKPPA